MLCGRGAGILPDCTVPRAQFEIEVMEQLARSAGAAGSLRQLHAPRILDHGFTPVGPSQPEAFVCRIAMTRLPGQPLCDWLASRKQRAQAAQGALGGDAVGEYCSSFFRAAKAVRTMLEQL